MDDGSGGDGSCSATAATTDVTAEAQVERCPNKRTKTQSDTAYYSSVYEEVQLARLASLPVDHDYPFA